MLCALWSSTLRSGSPRRHSDLDLVVEVLPAAAKLEGMGLGGGCIGSIPGPCACGGSPLRSVEAKAGLARNAGGAQWLPAQAEKPVGMTINDPRVMSCHGTGVGGPPGHKRQRGAALPHLIGENGEVGEGIHGPFLSGSCQGSAQEKVVAPNRLDQ